MANRFEKTWSMSTACPARMLIHSLSGNWGREGLLNSERLADFGSREMFSRIALVRRKFAESSIGSIALLMAQGKAEGTNFFRSVCELSSSSSFPRSEDRLRLRLRRSLELGS